VGSASAALPVHAQRVHAEPVDAVPVPGVRGGLVNPKAVAHSFDPSAALAQRPAALSADSTTLQSREQVRDALAQVREWIEHHEPSSPVAVLLKQAERMWGKRFSEVAHMIPPDLLRAWDQSD
jgi:predicted component of type VI protein secretion system